MESLAINNPFVDGNKRIAFAAADIFLRINGWRLEGDQSQFFTEIIQMLETKDFKRETLVSWLKNHSKQINGIISKTIKQL